MRYPICNGDIRSAATLGSVTLPLCWRCAAICLAALPAFSLNVDLAPWVTLLAAAPCILDGAVVHLAGWDGSNARRIATGIPAGVALASIARDLEVIVAAI
jgi:uncharacterized membrane protein